MSAQPPPSRPASESRRSSTMVKRQSILPKPSSIVLDPSVLIAQHAQLTGTHPVTVGANTVLHPGCKISSAFAPVVLGEGVVIYERARVGLGTGDNADADIRRSSGVVRSGEGSSIRSEGTVLGNNVVVETGAVVEAYELGEGCVVEVGAVVGRGCIIGKYCTISAGTNLPMNTNLPDYTVVYSGSARRIDKTLQSRPEVLHAKMLMHSKQLDMFKRLVPNNVAKYIT